VKTKIQKPFPRDVRIANRIGIITFWLILAFVGLFYYCARAHCMTAATIFLYLCIPTSLVFGPCMMYVVRYENDND
jgi:hypothetical protein